MYVKQIFFSSSVTFEISDALIKHLPIMIVAVYFYLFSLSLLLFSSIEIIFRNTTYILSHSSNIQTQNWVLLLSPYSVLMLLSWLLTSEQHLHGKQKCYGTSLQFSYQFLPLLRKILKCCDCEQEKNLPSIKFYFGVCLWLAHYYLWIKKHCVAGL